MRSAGIVLHVSSLPGPWGIGDLGPAAYAWVDSLTRAQQTWWQVLPLGPAAEGNSPYQCFSAFAGNPNLISPDGLIKDGLLRRADCSTEVFAEDHVDYKRVERFKSRLFSLAWDRFRTDSSRRLRSSFEEYCQAESEWLDDFALFMALKEAKGGASWLDWPEELVLRKPFALKQARRELRDAIGKHQFIQFLFSRQLGMLRRYAHARGIRLMGDLAMFVSGESADVWANPELFQLDKHRRPTAVAGVPPDYFSKTGQRWGNPLYNWPAMRRQGYAWWIARLRRTLAQVDWVRIDHFRGFEAYWRIPAHLPTAEHGRWVKALGAELFQVFRMKLGDLHLIAEDLGAITPEVEELRDAFRLPSMRVLQFAFGKDADDRFLPHNYGRNTIVYTGTHDNNTTCGWYVSLSAKGRADLRRYASYADGDENWVMLRLAWASVSECAMAPLQDVLGLGAEARMNTPGRPRGNWQWRFVAEQLTPDVVGRLADLTRTYARHPR
ncbi:MAG: 4-alpha-glucanotransferase [Bacillota bacterium]